MITMHAEPGAVFRINGHDYTADAKGLFQALAEDVADIRTAGAATGVLPATITLKANPGQQFYFMGKTHQADARGLIADVPFDFAVTQIKAKACTEATEADLTASAPAPEAPMPAPAAESAPEAPASPTAGDDTPAL